MKYGIYVPNCWNYGSVAALTRLARAAEHAGWDGFFIWDHLFVADDIPVVDPQIALASIAAATAPDGLRHIGALVTPLARRRPWKVARETAALQELSQGRLVVGVGLGRPPEYDFATGEPATSAARAAALDDGLELLKLFWEGKPVRWSAPDGDRPASGRTTEVDAPAFLPAPVPRPPVWVAGAIQYDDPDAERAATGPSAGGGGRRSAERTVRQPRRPFRRAAAHDGLFPVRMPWDNAHPLSPQDLSRAIRLTFPTQPPPRDYDIVVTGRSAGPDAPVPPGDLDAYEERGATWWLEAMPDLATLEEAQAAIAAGPPPR
ncbi:LLM class flavin-dependent oxidoreductase [Streptomyces sp. NPDC088864]|uniref:LLM class flavin-dependent oxidoreductase n=1 Tax=Streptomyces sp. NPDC088864 TaxID=3365910 RepID=UPI003824CC7F